MLSESEVFRIYLHGQFRVETSCGTDLTPKSEKAQGLLALIASDLGFRRSRTWLQDKLWSDRGQPQGAASLRQALTEIRKAFKNYSDILYTNRRVVALNKERIRIVANADFMGASSEFLEGIDIRDPEFEDWLRLMRSRDTVSLFSEKSVARPPKIERLEKPETRVIVLQPTNDSRTSLRIIEDQFIDSTFKTLKEMFCADILFQMPENTRPGMLIVSVQAFELKETHLGIRALIEDVDNHHTVWSENIITKQVTGPISQSVDHCGLVHRLADAISTSLATNINEQRHDCDANALANVAVRKMFSMRHQELELADQLLAQAAEIEPRAIFHAWRAQLAAIQHIERFGPSKEELLERSKMQCSLALNAEPMNSCVLSSIANAQLILENNVVSSGELSKLSVEINPANPLAWWAWANSMLYSGNSDQAYSAAKTAQKLSCRSPQKFWTDFQVSLIAAVTGRTEEALVCGELSAALSPYFRPPLRYLIALYAKQDDQKNARRNNTKLQKIEPSFSIDRLAYDDTYPVSMMREAGLIDQNRLANLTT